MARLPVLALSRLAPQALTTPPAPAARPPPWPDRPDDLLMGGGYGLPGDVLGDDAAVDSYGYYGDAAEPAWGSAAGGMRSPLDFTSEGEQARSASGR